MSRVADEETLGKALQDPAFKQTLRQLLATDNVTNLGYLVRTWLYLASVLAVSITFLEMRADNDAAYLYKRSGFVECGRRRDYYRGGDGKLRDAITMRRQK